MKCIFSFFIPIIIILTFISCSNRHEKYIENIKGEWINDFTIIGDTETVIVYNFENDTSCSLFFDWYYKDGKYKINNDTIRITYFDNETKNYKIEKLSKDSLILNENGNVYRLHRKSLDYDSELEFERIIIISEGCIDGCNKYSIVLNKNGDVDYQIENKEHLKFKLEKSEIKELDSLFKYSYINNVNDKNLYLTIDGDLIKVKFEYNNQSKTIIGSTLNFPFSINPIVHKIIDFSYERKKTK